MMSRSKAMRLGKRQAEDMQPWLVAWPDKASCHATPSGFIFNDAHVEAISASFAAWHEGLNKVAQKRLLGVWCDLTSMANDAQRQRERKEKVAAEHERLVSAVGMADDQLLAWLAPLNTSGLAPWRTRCIVYKPRSTRSAHEYRVELENTAAPADKPVSAEIFAKASANGLAWQLTFYRWAHWRQNEDPILCDTLADALALVAAYQVQQ